MNYDPSADLIQVAEDCCADHGQISKAAALQNLQTVLRANPELSRELQRRMAAELKYGGQPRCFPK
jgi:hypothetical protein